MLVYMIGQFELKLFDENILHNKTKVMKFNQRPTFTKFNYVALHTSNFQ